MNIRQLLRINKIVFYVPIGIIIIIFRNNLIDNLSLIVGIPMLVFSFESLIYEIVSKNYRNESNRLGEELIKIILSATIIFAFDDNVEMISIIWGIIAIITALKELSKSIYEIVNKRKMLFFIVIAHSIVQIVFAILLIVEPSEHVTFHLILLGVEMELESVRVLLTIIYNKIRHDREKREELNAGEEN